MEYLRYDLGLSKLVFKIRASLQSFQQGVLFQQ